jgi:endonuclease G
MTHDERVRRLRAMLSQVAGPDGLEALSVPAQVGGQETVGSDTDATRDRAESALRKLRSGASISPEEAFGLEAIVLPDKRPVVFIHDNMFDPLLMDEWVHLNKPEVHARLEQWFTSIGRIELPTNPSIPYGGTGFVVGHNLLMTNRHVARLFTDGLGMQWRVTGHPPISNRLS